MTINVGNRIAAYQTLNLEISAQHISAFSAVVIAANTYSNELVCCVGRKKRPEKCSANVDSIIQAFIQPSDYTLVIFVQDFVTPVTLFP